VHPSCPAAVRVGIGLCFLRQNNYEKALEAFERAREVDPHDEGALIGCAMILMNRSKDETTEARGDIRKGLRFLTDVYQGNQQKKSKQNATVLNHLASHFFHKKAGSGEAHKKAQKLAVAALKLTTVDAIKAESHFHIARIFHVAKEYDQAFRHYYQATKLSPTFPLSWYGLGQMYIHKDDRQNASECFEKVLKFHPDNYETLKILGSLYGRSDNERKREKARGFLIKVTKMQDEDAEAWMELAWLLQRTDPKKALEAYEKALRLFKGEMEQEALPLPPELLDNMGCLYQQIGEYAKAQEKYEEALENCNKHQAQQEGTDDTYLRSIKITIKYNLGRLLELRSQKVSYPRIFKVTKSSPDNQSAAYMKVKEGEHVAVTKSSDGTWKATIMDGFDGMGEVLAEVSADGATRADRRRGILDPETVKGGEVTKTAKGIYEDILLETPDYRDCYVRLGCIERDQGFHGKAENNIKDGLKGGSKDDPVIWTLLANMNMAKKEFKMAQSTFEKINAESKNDPYAMLGLGNIWLDWAPSAPEEKRPTYLKRAFDYYQAVLKKDPTNIYAAHGIGCVYASQGKVNEAKAIFIQVREATNDVPEPWLNLAHIYYDQGFYINAIKLYENCLHRFFGGYRDSTIMGYMARACYKAGKYADASTVLVKALHLSPDDNMIRYNFGMAQIAQAHHALEHSDETVAMVKSAMTMLRNGRELFKQLKVLKKQKFTSNAAAREEKRANEYLQQAKQTEKRVGKVEADKLAKIKDVDQKLAEFKGSLEKEAEEQREQKRQEEAARIEKYKLFQQENVESKDLLRYDEPAPKRAGGGGKRKKKKEDDDDDDDDLGEEKQVEKKKRKTKKKKATEPKENSKKRKAKLKRDDDDDSDDSDSDEDTSKPAASAGKKSLLSKATVDSSDDDSDDMEPQANEPTAEAAAKVSKVLDDTSSEEDAE